MTSPNGLSPNPVVTQPGGNNVLGNAGVGNPAQAPDATHRRIRVINNAAPQ
jgi:hypothetical protein